MNTPPIYLILFMLATYLLNRPCIYCSLLLAILVLSLFDFQSNWFLPKHPEGSSTITTANETMSPPHGLPLAAASVASSLTHTAQAVLSLPDKMWQRGARMDGSLVRSLFRSEWTSGLTARKEWRIRCLDVVLRW